MGQVSGQDSAPGRPSPPGCLVSPRIGCQASLYSMISCGPHHTTIGNRELRQVATAVFRTSGQRTGSPKGDLLQSNERMSAPILPPPSRKPGAWAGASTVGIAESDT